MNNPLEIKGIENNTALDYMVFKSDWVVNNQLKFIRDSLLAHERFNSAFKHNNLGSTWNYKFYNIFSLTAYSEYFYGLYSQISHIARVKVADNRPLWIQAWLNFHQPDEVLKWHNHAQCIYHGYISIDPKNTSTRFDDYTIKNETGKIYIGPSYRNHEVVIHEPFDTPRITLAFDISDDNNKKFSSTTDINLSIIPIL